MTPRRLVYLDGKAMAGLLADVLSRGLEGAFRVRGGSMSPWIRDGDVVTVTPNREFRPGVVVAFRRRPGGHLVVHRILARAEGGWILRGDRCATLDGVIADGDVLGRVTSVARGGRRVLVPRGVAGLLLVGSGRLALRLHDRLRGNREAVAARPEA